MPDNDEKLTLANMKGGAAFEMVDRAIAQALENINDINTTLKKREVILKIALQPSEDRTIVSFDLHVDKKLAGQDGIQFTADLRMGIGGKCYAIERNRQRALPLANVIKMEDRD